MLRDHFTVAMVSSCRPVSRQLAFEHQGRFLDPDEAPFGVALREHVHLLAYPLSVVPDQIDDMAFRVAFAIDEFIQNSDRRPFNEFKQRYCSTEATEAVLQD